MRAETYDLTVSLLGSAVGGVVLFLVGVLLGYAFWGRMKKRAMLARHLGEGGMARRV